MVPTLSAKESRQTDCEICMQILLDSKNASRCGGEGWVVDFWALNDPLASAAFLTGSDPLDRAAPRLLCSQGFPGDHVTWRAMLSILRSTWRSRFRVVGRGSEGLWRVSVGICWVCKPCSVTVLRARVHPWPWGKGKMFTHVTLQVMGGWRLGCHSSSSFPVASTCEISGSSPQESL